MIINVTRRRCLVAQLRWYITLHSLWLPYTVYDLHRSIKFECTCQTKTDFTRFTNTESRSSDCNSRVSEFGPCTAYRVHRSLWYNNALFALGQWCAAVRRGIVAVVPGVQYNYVTMTVLQLMILYTLIFMLSNIHICHKWHCRNYMMTQNTTNKEKPQYSR